MIRKLILCAAVLTGLLAGPRAGAEPAEQTADHPTTGGAEMPPQALHPTVVMETTLGDITLQLDAEKAPVSTLNFVNYALNDFYESTIFHRVIPDFMIQGGGYLPDLSEKGGSQGPIVNEWQNGLKNERGTIAMARLGRQPNSATNQFFINTVDNPFLDQPNDGAGYAVFGRVIEGMDVVDKIRNVKTEPSMVSPVTPVEPVVIKEVRFVDEAARAYWAEKTASYDAAMQEAVASHRRVVAAAEARKGQELQEVIAKLEAETGNKVQTTPSGLKYVVWRDGEGESPGPTDRVKVHYEGRFLDGKVFDSSYQRNQPTEFGLNQVIRGWTEGVGMMKPGAKWTLIIPGDLAYGPAGRGEIPPNATLVFDIELLEVK
ncbi:MAG TPA: peptidylprolyl isomerase [Candidatus Sumerlaeota bacterium]|nr:peptidylprolyl isomerase [Candidatus Sumerlaeota bacterium]HPK03396.1 peptidylprolyl isomerase [Candidatus Sumerlaeota bacterium]